MSAIPASCTMTKSTTKQAPKTNIKKRSFQRINYVISTKEPHNHFICKGQKIFELRSFPLPSYLKNQYVAMTKSGSDSIKTRKETITEFISQYSKNKKIQQSLPKNEISLQCFINDLASKKYDQKVTCYIQFYQNIKITKSLETHPFFKDFLVYKEDGTLKYEHAWLIRQRINVKYDPTCIVKAQVGIKKIVDPKQWKDVNIHFRKACIKNRV